MTRTLTLIRSAQQPVVNENTTLGYRFTVTAASPDLSMPGEVFIMNQRPLDPTAPLPTPTADFFGICTPALLASLPINQPVAPDTRYRVAAIDVNYPTEEEGDVGWESIKVSVQDLLNALSISDRLNQVETVTYTA